MSDIRHVRLSHKILGITSRCNESRVRTALRARTKRPCSLPACSMQQCESVTCFYSSPTFTTYDDPAALRPHLRWLQDIVSRSILYTSQSVSRAFAPSSKHFHLKPPFPPKSHSLTNPSFHLSRFLHMLSREHKIARHFFSVKNPATFNHTPPNKNLRSSFFPSPLPHQSQDQ